MQPVVVVALVVIACLGVMISSVSIWAHRTIFNTNQWVSTVGPLARNDAVVSSATTRLTQELNQVIQPEQRVERVLPNRLKGLAAPLVQGFDQIESQAISGIIRSDAFYRFWVGLNRLLQPIVANALLGRPSKHLLTANGAIQLNFLPLVGQGLNAIHRRTPKLLPLNGAVPDITPTTPPDQARAEISQALGRSLPPNFGTPTLLRSSQLSTAQNFVKVFNTAIIALVVVTLVLIVGAIVLARRKRRTLILLGLGIVAAMGLAFAITRVIANALVQAITNPQNKGAVRATVGAVLNQLNDVSIVLIIAGLVLAVIAFLLGSGRVARAVRAQGAAVGRSLVGHSDRPAPAALGLIGSHRMELGLLGVGVAILCLIFVVEGWVGLLVTVLLLAAYEGILTWIARRASGHQRPDVLAPETPQAREGSDTSEPEDVASQ